MMDRGDFAQPSGRGQHIAAPIQPIGADALEQLRGGQVSDIESGGEVGVAQHLARTLDGVCGHVVKADGAFWAWGPTCWRELPENSLRLAVHRYNGVTVQGKRPIWLGRNFVSGVLAETGTILAEPNFFNTPSVALNAADTVIEIAKGGELTLRPHSPDDRFRFTIPARYGSGKAKPLPEGSMLHRLVTGAFDGDADAQDKIDLVGEILGSAAFGIATRLKQPKGFIFLGETASNGKSTIASLLDCLLPAGSVSHIPPSAFEDERRIVSLAGKAANVADELSASAIAGETFKNAVTGQPIQGRDVYTSAITFIPRALQLFTTNSLPRFHGGLDRGLQRRLVVLRFNRPIPESEIVEDIADRIRNDEMDLLLRFAIDGARRLSERRAYTIPASSTEALRDWLRMDPIVEWFEQRMVVCNGEPIGGWHFTSELFRDFKTWAIDQGHAEKFLPIVNTFGQRLKAMSGIETRRHAKGTVIIGATLAGNEPASFRSNDPW